MRVFVLLLTCVAFGGCGGDAAVVESHRTSMSIEDPEPQEPAPVKEAKALRRDIDSIRCFLLHEKEVKEGRAPKDWKQPSMEEYDKSSDPCALLPGFVDPRKEERKKKIIPPIRPVEDVGLRVIRRRK